MASQDRNAAGGQSVTISRDHRDALHHEIRNYSLACDGPLSDFHACISQPGRGTEAARLWAQIANAARLLEQLGWDRAGDREVYELSIDDELAAWVLWWLEQTEGNLTVDAEILADVRAGRDPWQRVRASIGDTLEEEVAGIRATADRDLECVAACRAILNQLEGGI